MLASLASLLYSVVLYDERAQIIQSVFKFHGTFSSWLKTFGSLGRCYGEGESVRYLAILCMYFLI